MTLVPILYASEDGKYIQALTWKQDFAETGIDKIFKMEDLWNEKLELSRFTHVPLGNLTSDVAIEASDIFYGRLLSLNRYILWASTSATPDLGGYIINNYDEEIKPFEISNKGVYRSICIELKIKNLIINTIRMSDHLSDMEDVETDDISQQFGFCDTAYNILKMLIGKWLSASETTDLQYNNIFIKQFTRLFLR